MSGRGRHERGTARARVERGRPPQVPSVQGPRPLLVAFLFFLLGIALYGNTIGHDYALDDTIVITDNGYTKSGIRGIPDIFAHDSFQGFFQEQKRLVSGGRYRPLSIATFAIEYQLVGLNPHVSHAVNVVLYGLTGAVLYLLLRRLLQADARARWWLSPALLITLLYMTHPLHTEVVANIKGRDEVLAFLFGMGAFHASLSYYERRVRGATWSLVMAGICIVLGLLAKESTLPLLLLIPIGLWFFRGADRKRLASLTAVLILSTIPYLALRYTYAGPMTPVKTDDILNDPFIGASLEQRVATVFKTFGIYLRLFFFPHPLSHDYYYNQVPLTNFESPASLIPLVIALALALFAIRGIPRRSPIAYGILFFTLSFSIVSNLMVSVGTTMAERFLYIPSLGLVTALVYCVESLAERWMGLKGLRAAGIALLALSAAFSAKTIARNPAWKDNFTLFTTDVRVAPRSAKVQAAAGRALLEASDRASDPALKRRLLDEAIGHLQKAVEIHPKHSLAWLQLGNAWFRIGGDKLVRAVQCYQHLIAIDPGVAAAYRNLAVAADKLGDHATALSSIRRYRSAEPMESEAALLEAQFCEEAGQTDDAITVLERLLREQPRNGAVWGRAGHLYARYRHDYAKASEYLQRAVALDPGHASYFEDLSGAQIMLGQKGAALRTLEDGIARFGDTYLLDWNLGVVWQQLGDPKKAEGYFSRANQTRGSRTAPNP